MFRRWLVRLVAAAVIAAATVVVGAPAAGAHPRLLSAEPEPSSTVDGPLPEVVVRFDEQVLWEYSEIDVENVDGDSLLGGEPQLTERQAVLPLASDAAGAMRVFWRLVGNDSHPQIGAFVIGVRGPPGSAATADLDLALQNLGAVGEAKVGSDALAWAIRGGRSLEIVVLYGVLGILLLRVLVLRGRLALPAGGPGTTVVGAVGRDRGYRTMLPLGLAAIVITPLVFVLYVARLDSVFGGVDLGDVVFSSLGQTWALKLALWAAVVAACGYGLRRHPAGSRQHDLLLLALAASAAVAFGYNTHASGQSPEWIWNSMMWGHIMVTAFWAGGLVALLLLVFPTGDPPRVWRTVGRFSNLMTASVVIIIASGLLMMLQLVGNPKRLWCSDFGIVVGFKMAVVGIALIIGAVNNRLVSYQKRSLDAPVSRFRPRKERSVGSLRRLVAIEAAILGSAILLSAALGETELPSVFEGDYYPADLQENVSPGLFGSGCQ